MVTLLIIILCIVLILLTIAQFVCRSFNKPKINFSLKESLDLVNLPIITMEIQGRKLNFLVDTGGDQSCINEAAIEGLEYISSQSKKTMISALGEAQCSTCELDLEYKGYCFTTVFYIADFSNAFTKIKEESGVTLHGILGNLFLIEHKYVLDFADLKMFSKK